MSFKKQGDPVAVRSLDEQSNEECSILIGSFFNGRYGSRCFVATEFMTRLEGAPHEVKFDWRQIYALEDEGIPIIGWFHTHPFQEHIGYSPTDDMTMRAWCRCLGRDLLCIIGNNSDVNEIYLFSKDGYQDSCIRYDYTINTFEEELYSFIGFFNSGFREADHGSE